MRAKFLSERKTLRSIIWEKMELFRKNIIRQKRPFCTYKPHNPIQSTYLFDLTIDVTQFKNRITLVLEHMPLSGSPFIHRQSRSFTFTLAFYRFLSIYRMQLHFLLGAQFLYPTECRMSYWNFQVFIIFQEIALVVES